MQLTSCFDAIGHNKRACSVNLQNAIAAHICTSYNTSIEVTKRKLLKVSTTTKYKHVYGCIKK